MTKPLVPIENHKDKDLRLIRKKLLETIESNKATAKDITDASKLLARMHKALAPEKVVDKTLLNEQKAQQELSDVDKAVIKEALGFK
jgi:hypothetical protein